MKPTLRLTSLVPSTRLGLASALLLAGLQSHAADGTWIIAPTGTTAVNWSAASLWSGGTVADGAGFTANFTGVDIAAAKTVTLDSARTIGNITFTDATTANNNLTISGANPLTLEVATGSPTLNVTNQILSVSSTVAGTQGLTKTGAGQLTLSGANTLTGPVLVNAGILNIANYSGLGGTSPGTDAPSSITVTGGASLYIQQVGTGTTSDTNYPSLSLNGNLRTTGGSGTNQLLLTWAGNVTLTGNSLIWANGNSSIRVNGLIDLGSNTLTYQTDGSISSNIIAGGITGSGNFAKTSTNTLFLNSATSYTGNTSINAGTLSLGHVNALAATSGITMSATSAATLSTQTDGITLASPVTLSGSGINSSIAFGRNSSAIGSLTLNGPISGDGNLILTTPNVASGGNVQTIVLGSANTYAGSTTITTPNVNNSVTVKAGAANALPATTVLTLNGGAGAGSGRAINYDLNGNNQTLAGLTNVTGLSLRNQRVINTGALATLTINNAADFSFGGFVSGTTSTSSTIAGPISLVKQGSGTFTLTGAANSFTGSTKVLGGILSLAHTGSLQNSPVDTAASIAGDATNGLQAAVTTLTFGGLTGDKNLGSIFTTTAGGYSNLTSLTLNTASGSSYSYSGAIPDGDGMTLLKTGSGTQVFSATNTYTNGTTVNGGTLLLEGAANLPAAGTLTVNSGATFSLADGVARTTTGAGLSLANSSIMAFDWNGASLDSLTASGNGSATGNVFIQLNASSPSGPGGTLVSAAAGSTLDAANYYLVNNTNYTAPLGKTATSLTVGTYTSVSHLAVAYWLGGQLGGAAGAMSLSTGAVSNWVSDAAGASAGGLVPGAGSSHVVFGAAGASEQSVVSASAAMSLGGITFNDSASVTVSGPGSLTLNSTSATAAFAASAFAAVTPGAAVTVTPFANETNSIAAPVVLGADQTWHVATGKTLAVSGVVSGGTFGLTKAGVGTLSLSSTPTFTGTLNISAGAVTLSPAAAMTLATPIAGSGTLNLFPAAANNLTLSGPASGFSGVINVAANTGVAKLQLGSSTSLGAGAVINIADGATCYVSNAATVQEGVTFNILGMGNSENIGAVRVDTATIGATSSLVLKANGSIGGNASTGTINAVISELGDSFSLTKQGASTIVLGAANTHTGATVVAAGTLSLANPLALQHSAIDTAASVAGAAAAGLRIASSSLTLGGLSGDKNLSSLFTATSGGFSTLSSLTLNPGAGKIVSYSANISDGAAGMSLTKSGLGTQILSGNCAYTGLTTVSSGVLQIGAGGLTGSINGTSGIVNHGTIAFSRSDDVGLPVPISGTGSVAQNGPGTLILAGSDSYTGGTTVNAGTLSVSAPNFADASTVAIATGALLHLNFSGTDTVAALVLNGVSQPAGVYNAANTAAYLTGTGSITVGTPGPSVGSFTSSSFTLAEQGNTAVSGPNADPDGDGVSNILEYAFASNPKVSGRANLPVANTTLVGGSGYIGCVYTRVKGATDLTFAVQFSSTPDSAAFTNAVPGVDYTIVGTVDNGSTETITIRDNTPVTSVAKRFVRILVTYP